MECIPTHKAMAQRQVQARQHIISGHRGKNSWTCEKVDTTVAILSQLLDQRPSFDPTFTASGANIEAPFAERLYLNTRCVSARCDDNSLLVSLDRCRHWKIQ